MDGQKYAIENLCVACDYGGQQQQQQHVAPVALRTTHENIRPTYYH